MRISSLFFFVFVIPSSESFSRFPTPTNSISVSPSFTNTKTSTLSSSLTLSPTDSRTISSSLSLSPSITSNSSYSSSTTMYFTYSPLLSDTVTQTQTQTVSETQTKTYTPSTTLIVIPQTNDGLNLQGMIAIGVLGSILGSMLLFFIVLKIIGSKKILKSLESKVEAVATQAITTQAITTQAITTQANTLKDTLFGRLYNVALSLFAKEKSQVKEATNTIVENI